MSTEAKRRVSPSRLLSSVAKEELPDTRNKVRCMHPARRLVAIGKAKGQVSLTGQSDSKWYSVDHPARANLEKRAGWYEWVNSMSLTTSSHRRLWKYF